MIFQIKQSEIIPKVENCIKNGLHGVLYCTVERPIAFVYKEKQVDASTCRSMGYEVCEVFYNGGTILGNEGDFVFAHTGKVGNNWCEAFVQTLMLWLQAKGLNVSRDRNDVLVDGHKVCGMCVTRYGCIDYTCGFVSINNNLEHIKEICRKPMVKIPTGLGEYGITTEAVEKMFLAFCEIYTAK